MTTAVEQFVGATAYDVTGHKIGKIHQIFVDAHTREPKWVSVHTGLFGLGSSLVPLAGANCSPDTVTVAVDKATVKHAPNLRVRAGITPHEEHRLARYYELPQIPEPAPAPPPRQSAGRHSIGVDAIAAAAGMGGTAANTSAQHNPDHPREPGL